MNKIPPSNTDASHRVEMYARHLYCAVMLGVAISLASAIGPILANSAVATPNKIGLAFVLGLVVSLTIPPIVAIVRSAQRRHER